MTVLFNFFLGISRSINRKQSRTINGQTFAFKLRNHQETVNHRTPKVKTTIAAL